MVNKAQNKSGIYQSPLQKLFTRQQPKVKAKKGMARLLMTYAEGDSERVARVIQAWLEANR
ncbi:hypothetical protein [Paraglaciecola sp. L3A3]|uniref:hypothetical protein n=1 Tax=Paraglaciecola sp. L3A3 TaxID=2686358 RepID=UPI00131BE5D6|nr:hypothetical protein [Paraglaciecola sp. L3A3]